MANCASEQGCDEKGPVLLSLKYEVSYFGASTCTVLSRAMLLGDASSCLRDTGGTH